MTLSCRSHILSFPSLSHFVVSIRNHFGSNICCISSRSKFGSHIFLSATMPRRHQRTRRFANLGRQIRGTLVQKEQQFLWDLYQVKLAVHRRRLWDKDEMTVMGNPDNICAAVDMARHIMEYKIRQDRCMQVYGFSK